MKAIDAAGVDPHPSVHWQACQMHPLRPWCAAHAHANCPMCKALMAVLFPRHIIALDITLTAYYSGPIIDAKTWQLDSLIHACPHEKNT